MNSKTLLYILKRLALAILTVWIVITVTFFVTRAVPGGPFLGEKALSAEAQAALEAKYGLDKPVHVQYFTYLGDILLRFRGTQVQTAQALQDLLSQCVCGEEAELEIYRDGQQKTLRITIENTTP